jgi:hypothetical protein
MAAVISADEGPDECISGINRRWRATRLQDLSLDDRRHMCYKVVDDWFNILLSPHRAPRSPAQLLQLSYDLFRTTPASSSDGILRSFKEIESAWVYFEAILQEPEVGLLLKRSDGYMIPTAEQRLTHTRIRQIRRSLACLRDMAVGCAMMHQMSVSPFMEISDHQTGGVDNDADDDHDEHQLIRWLQGECVKHGFLRGKDGLMRQVYTMLGLATGVYETSDELTFDNFLVKHLPSENSLWLKWQRKHGQFDSLAKRWLTSAGVAELPNHNPNRHLRSFANGVLNISTLSFTAYTNEDWAPHMLEDWRAADNTARRALREEVEEEIRNYQTHNTNGATVMVDAEGNSFTKACRERNEDAFSGINRGLGVPIREIGDQSLMFLDHFLPPNVLTMSLEDLNNISEAWYSILSYQGYTSPEEQLIVNGMLGRSFFNVCPGAPHHGDGFQKFLMFFGPPGNGKSTIVDFVSRFFPRENIAMMSNSMEKVFFGMTWENAFVALAPELNHGFMRTFGTAEFMSFAANDTVVLKFKNAPSKSIRWGAQIITASNEQSFTGQGFERRAVIVRFDNIIPPKDIDPELPLKLQEDMAKLLVLWARSYHAMREKAMVKGGGLNSILPLRFKKSLEKFSTKLNPLSIFLTEGSECLLFKHHKEDEQENITDWYVGWDTLKSIFNKWQHDSNGESMDLTDEDIYLPVFTKLGIYMELKTMRDPITQQDRRTKWCFGVKSLKSNFY